LSRIRPKPKKDQERNQRENRNGCRYLSLPKTLMLNSFPKAKADVELFIIKFVADFRKSGKDSIIVDLL
jgi:hypothetical protein